MGYFKTYVIIVFDCYLQFIDSIYLALERCYKSDHTFQGTFYIQ